MAQERTEGVVLRGVDFSETSRVITLLTPDRGRLVCMAKGVRRKNSALAPVLDTFNRVEVLYYWKDGRAVQTMAEASLLDAFDAIKRNLEKSVFAAWPLEVAGKTAHENEPSGPLYAMLVQGLEGLGAWTSDVRAHACWQVVQLLSAAGFEPSLDTCAGCGKPVGDAPGFSFGGGVTCSRCPADHRLTPDEYTALRALVGSREACPEQPAVGRVYDLLHRYAARQLETDLRSVRVIDQMF